MSPMVARGVLVLTAAFCCPVVGVRADTHFSGPQLHYGVRDSADIRIVENRRPEIDSRLEWVVAAEPDVTIGTRDGSGTFQLYRVRDATRLADGRIVVANGGSDELLVFSADGEYVGAWGGRGEGPGEFESLALVRPWGPDSLIAADAENGRISTFGIDGGHGSTKSLRGERASFRVALEAGSGLGREGAAAALGVHNAVTVMPDGRLLTNDTGGYGAQGLWRDEGLYAMMGPDGSSRVSIGEFPGPEHYSESYMEGNTVYVTPLRHPFGRATLTTVWGDLAVIGRNETYEIRAYRSDGFLIRILRRDHEVRSPTKAEQDAAFRDQFAEMADDDAASKMRVAVNAPVLESFPAYSSLRGDALGHLWVAEYKLPDARYEGTLWTVFDPDGRALGFVQTPDGFRVFEIGADYILGRTTDELGVEYVHVLTLGRSDS